MSLPFETIMSSITILVLIIVLAGIFLKANQKVYAYTISPMALIPAMYLVGGYVASKFTYVLSFSQAEIIHLTFIIISLVVAFILSGFACTKIKSISRRIIMIVMLYGFFIIYALHCIFSLPNLA